MSAARLSWHAATRVSPIAGAKAGPAWLRRRARRALSWRGRRGRRWRAGLVVALVGEAIRVWAAGHLEKGREVTRSGPYRWTRASAVCRLVDPGARRGDRRAQRARGRARRGLHGRRRSPRPIRTEEAFLRRAFGDTYDRYQRSEAEPMRGASASARAMRNREYRAVAGLLVGFALLALKVLLPI